MNDYDSLADLGLVPFSRFGSWMVMGLRSGNRLILKNVHNSGEALFQPLLLITQDRQLEN